MNDTIAAISTARGVGAISIVRVSGKDAFSIVSSLFSNKEFESALSHTIHYGYIMDGEEKVDEVLVSKMIGPRTFTTEDVAEINCHGGISTTNKVLELLLSNGCRLAEPGEFTKRAYLNGRIDLTEASGIIDLINSKSESARKMAINQVSGKVSLLIDDLRDDLALILSNIEVNLNYPEYDDIEDVTVSKIRECMGDISSKLGKIERESRNGEIIKNGIDTVIVGRPNVGKSSLLNCLVGEDKAIVTEISGTTRDSVECSVVYDDIVLNLIDTAGIRDTDDKVESIGISKSLDFIDRADLVLFVVNYNEKLSLDDRKIMDRLKGKSYITVVNKCDLDRRIEDDLVNPVYVSALNDENISGIIDKIRDLFDLSRIDYKDLTYLGSALSRSYVSKALELCGSVMEGIKSGFSLDMIEIDLRELWEVLGKIVGKEEDGELIDEIFSRFCVGK